MLIAFISLFATLSILVPQSRHKVIYLILTLCGAMVYFQDYKIISIILYPFVFIPLFLILFHCKEDSSTISLRKYRKKVYLEKIFVISCLLISSSYLGLIIVRGAQAGVDILEKANLKNLPVQSTQKILIVLILVLSLGFLHFKRGDNE